MKDRFRLNDPVQDQDDRLDEIYDNFTAYPSDLPLNFELHPAAALEGFRGSEDNPEEEWAVTVLEDSKGG